jgi:PAS domain S-box-containing protein
MITETDIKGCITYANRRFTQITGYSLNELIGTPHSIVRHPKMPRAAFKEMWETLHRGLDWNGYVINLTKDGSYYWVHVYITPRYDEANRIVGYIAARKVPSELTLNKIKKKYETLLEYEASATDDYARDSVA